MRYIKLQHFQQPRNGECLPACIVMVLAYQGQKIRYRRILRVLKTVKGLGTPSSNIRHLQQMGYRVTYQQGSISKLRRHLEQNEPCIVFVQTGDLPHWDANVQHAILVVGITETDVIIHDPEFAYSPIIVPIGDFDLAWLEHDELYAVIIR